MKQLENHTHYSPIDDLSFGFFFLPYLAISCADGRHRLVVRTCYQEKCLFCTLFLDNEEQPSEKNYRAMFFKRNEGHMQKFS